MANMLKDFKGWGIEGLKSSESLLWGWKSVSGLAAGAGRGWDMHGQRQMLQNLVSEKNPKQTGFTSNWDVFQLWFYFALSDKNNKYVL